MIASRNAKKLEQAAESMQSLCAEEECGTLSWTPCNIRKEQEVSCSGACASRNLLRDGLRAFQRSGATGLQKSWPDPSRKVRPYRDVFSVAIDQRFLRKKLWRKQDDVTGMLGGSGDVLRKIDRTLRAVFNSKIFSKCLVSENQTDHCGLYFYFLIVLSKFSPQWKTLVTIGVGDR